MAQCAFDSGATLSFGANEALLTLQEAWPRNVTLPYINSSASVQAGVVFVPMGPSAEIIDTTDAPCRQSANSLGTCDFWHFGSLRSLVDVDGTQHGCMCQCCAPIARRHPQRCQWTGLRGIDKGAGGSTLHSRLTKYIKISAPEVATGTGRCGDGFLARAAHACDALHLAPEVAEQIAEENALNIAEYPKDEQILNLPS